VLARIDESLALCGTDKSKILSAIIYIADVKQKAALNRAWDEWVDPKNPPMARLPWRRPRAASIWWRSW
jgi:enamine deaminase RidA (YjgF/YER057c/UK114 family)